jgi:hypothetical protein
MEISAPFNVRRGTASTSPIVRMDAKARAKVNWAAASLAQKARAVFDSFVEVFHENRWHYAAGSFPGLQTIPILLGQQTMQQLEVQFHVSPTMDCGRIRNLLAVAMQALLPVTPSDARVTGLFITRPMGTPPPGVQGSFTCIDPNVYGNVRTTTVPYQLVQQCIFEDHYAVKLNETGLIYDACLVAIYWDINVVVDTLLKKSPADPNVLIPRMPPPPGGPRVTRYQAMRNESPNGFSTGYMRLN